MIYSFMDLKKDLKIGHEIEFIYDENNIFN